MFGMNVCVSGARVCVYVCDTKRYIDAVVSIQSFLRHYICLQHIDTKLIVQSSHHVRC